MQTPLAKVSQEMKSTVRPPSRMTAGEKCGLRNAKCFGGQGRSAWLETGLPAASYSTADRN